MIFLYEKLLTANCLGAPTPYTNFQLLDENPSAMGPDPKYTYQLLLIPTVNSLTSVAGPTVPQGAYHCKMLHLTPQNTMLLKVQQSNLLLATTSHHGPAFPP